MIAPAPAIVLAAALLQGPVGSPAPLPPLSVCDVLASWRDHHGNAVRVQGTYSSGFERSSLSGPGCRGRVWVTWRGTKDPRVDEAIKRMRARGGVTGIAVVVEGVFQGPAPRANGTAARYGHLGGYVAQLEVTKVLGVGKDHAPK